MEHLFWVWLAFNIVFGMWSARNWLYWLCGALTNKTFIQSDLGRVLDLITLVSVLSMIFMFNFEFDGSTFKFTLDF